MASVAASNSWCAVSFAERARSGSSSRAPKCNPLSSASTSTVFAARSEFCLSGTVGRHGFWPRVWPSSCFFERRAVRCNVRLSVGPSPESYTTDTAVDSSSSQGNVDNNGGLRLGTLAAKATSSSYGGAESFSGDDHDSAVSSDVDTEQISEPFPGPSKDKGSIQAVGVLAAVLGIGCLAGLGLALNSGGPTGLLSIVSKSGFPAAFALIFVSEIGDKTFFIAALLAMRHSKWLVLVGASGALAVMTVISVIIGKLCQRVPAQLQTTLPIGEYAAVALLIWFGLRSIKNAWDIPSPPSGTQGQSEEIGELAEAEEFLKQSDKKVTTPLEVLTESFTLIFVAEWGDRSMLATIALGAAQSPWGVASGAIAGHVLATLLAVVGGALLARYLSEKLIGYFGGFLFLVFAAATSTGVF